MFVVYATPDRPFLFPPKDGLPARQGSTAVFRTAAEAAQFLEEQEFGIGLGTLASKQ